MVMKNIKMDELETLIKHANIEASESTCKKLQVGAVLVRDGRIICTGRNGVPSKERHCCSIDWQDGRGNFGGPGDLFVVEDGKVITHHEWSKQHEAHAEMNCICRAARYGIATDGAALVVTTEPCLTCAIQIIACGIIEVVYKSHYNMTPGEGTLKLKNNNVHVVCAGDIYGEGNPILS